MDLAALNCLVDTDRLAAQLDADELRMQRYARPGRLPTSVNVPFGVTVDLSTSLYDGSLTEWSGDPALPMETD